MLPATRFALLLTFLASCAGCGDPDGAVPVAGTITLDGQPLAGVQVTFDQPDLGANANVAYTGRTDSQGHYTLESTSDKSSGIKPGKYRVALTTAVHDPSAPPPQAPPPTDPNFFYPESAPPPPERIPLPYRGGKLSFEVPADGTDQANFELKSK
jgi:hypothetical protein